MMMKNKLLILLSFFLPLFISPALVSSQFHELNWYCLNDRGNYTANGSYLNNLKPLLAYLTDQASHAGFGNYSVGEGIERVSVIYNCRGDLDGDSCHDCIQLAAQRILTVCPVQKEAIFWHQECMIRYSNRTIFSTEEETPYVWDYSNANVSDPLQYDQVVAKTVDGLIMEAAYNQSKEGYAIGEGNASGLVEGNKVYSYVQCTRDILGSRCERCLRAAFRAMAGCCGTTRESLEFYYPSCQIYYSPEAFIRETASAPALSPALQPNSSSPLTQTTGGSTATIINAYGDILTFGLIVAVNMLFFMPISS